MTWEFVDYDAFEGGCRIQVEQYPFLTCSRLENGEWRLIEQQAGQWLTQ